MIPAHTSRRAAQRRSVRVTTPAVRVKLAGTFGRLMNISASGALVLVQRSLDAKRVWPLMIEVAPQTVEIHARVIRSHAVSIQLPGATWQRQEYAVALTFTEVPDTSRDVLKALCGDAFAKLE
jgi:hypothetical protein